MSGSIKVKYTNQGGIKLTTVHWKDRMNYFMQNELRQVKSYDDFKDFLDKIKGKHELRSKRSGRRVFGFSKYTNPEKCHYLIDDGISTGLCYWENLHKVIFVEDE